jgi:ribosomal protein L32E
MADNETRSREDEYFWRKDQELIEKMRRAAAGEQANREMGKKTGLNDPETIRELAALGFTIDTVDLLPLMPVIQVAWAEGGVSDAERRLITNLARSRGIGAGSAADRQLSTWLATPPDAQVFTRSTRLIRAMLTSPASPGAAMTPEELVKYCEEIAAASGGILGMRKISAEERALLSQIATELKSRNE